MAELYPGRFERPTEDQFDARRLFIDVHEANMSLLQASLADTRKKRVAVEIRSIMRIDPTATDFVTCAPLPDSNCQQFICSVLGPENSPYELGIFHIMLVLSETYPHQAPYCRFLTDVYHPDIAPEGTFNCDILEARWCPALTIDKVLMTVISMLTEVSSCEPLNPEAASALAENPDLYEATARTYTKQHASKGPPPIEYVRGVGDAMLDDFAGRWAGILRTSRG